MVNDADILQHLSKVLNEEDLSSAVRRILYVPEAWREIHKIEFLTLAVEKIDRAGWSPATLASLAIGQPSLADALGSITPEQESRIERLLNANDDDDDRNLVDIALLSVTLLRVETDEGLDALTEAIFERMGFWASPLSCAWPYLEFGQEVIHALIGKENREAIDLAIQILRTNMDVERAVEILSNLDLAVIRRVLTSLDRNDDELYRAVSESIRDEIILNLVDIQRDPGELSEHALILAAAGDAAEAQKLVSDAWDQTTMISAQVADRLADIAIMDDDPVLEVEARKQAFQLEQTPLRRAELAKALVQIDRPQDALDLIRDPKTAEECIAAGHAYLLSNESELAADCFLQAYKQAMDVPNLDPTWMTMLSSGLDYSGKYHQAVRVLEDLSTYKPVDAELRQNLASLFEKAGDPYAAAEQAAFALTLMPKSLELREILARTLQKSDRFELAIPHWQAITVHNKQAHAKLSACALEAGDYTLAKESAENLREENPASVEAQVLLGKALAALGEHEEAEAHLKKVTQLTPTDAEAWIALSECQRSTGNGDTADETLEAALQANPLNGAVHVAKANTLRSKSLPTEALEYVEKAVDLEPEQTEWLVEQGDLLRELGRPEEAAPILQSALDKQPENWKAREALALTLESQGENASAAAVIERLPVNLGPESLWNAGRILVQIPSDEEFSLELGVKTLEKAREAGYDSAAIDYWIAHGLRGQGLHEDAIDHYQSFLDNTEENPGEAHLQGVLGLANAAIEMDDAILAIASMEKHRGQYPTSLEMLMLLARAHMSNDDHSVAKNLARQAFERNPIETEALSILSIAAEADGSLDEAIEARKQLANLQPDLSDPWLELARLAWISEDKEASRKHLARGLYLGRNDKPILQKAAALCGEFKLHPLQLRLLKHASTFDEHDAGIHTELASVAESIGDYEQAQQSWMHIADLLPNDTHPLDRAADALWNMDKRTAAIGLWEQATQIDPENALHFSALGRAYMQIGETQRSLNCFGHALALQPEDPSFLLEAGLAMTCSGSPEEGLGALQKAVSIVPNDPVPLIALAETLHLLGRNSDARAALDRAAILAPLSVKGFALQAITALETGEIEQAKDAFNSVLTIEPQDLMDVVWSTRSAVAHTDWDAAIHSVEKWMGAGNDNPDTTLEYLRGQLRLQDLLWLYRSACEAGSHAPSQVELSGEKKSYLQKMIDEYRATGSNESIGELLQSWFDLTTGEESPAEEWNVSQNFPQRILREYTQAYALSQIRANRPAKAENALLQDNGPGYKDPYHTLLLGKCRMMLGSVDDAVDTLQQIQGNSLIRPLALFLEAQLWLQEKNDEKAISALNSALSIWPNEPLWQSRLALLYQKNDKLEAALPHWQNAVELEPENGDYLTSLARSYRQAGQLTDAQAMYAKSLQTSSVEPKVWKEAGDVALAIGDAEKAEAWFERACSLMPSDVGVMVGSSRASMALGNVKQALDHARKAYKLAPNDVEVLTGLGDVFAHQGKLEKAIQIYDRALRVSEEDRAVQLARSKLLLRLGRTGEAVADLQTLTEIEPEFEEAWAALSEAHSTTGDKDAALEASSKAAKLAPRNMEYQLLLGRMFRESGQLDQALSVLSKASSLAPVDPRIARELGEVHEARRQHSQALDAYLQAITLDPKEGTTYKKAGLILKTLKSYGQAADMFEKAVSINPLDPDTLHQLAAVRALQLVHGGLEEQAVTL